MFDLRLHHLVNYTLFSPEAPDWQTGSHGVCLRDRGLHSSQIVGESSTGDHSHVQKHVYTTTLNFS